LNHQSFSPILLHAVFKQQDSLTSAGRFESICPEIKKMAGTNWSTKLAGQRQVGLIF
jgi:hypothetical protein